MSKTIKRSAMAVAATAAGLLLTGCATSPGKATSMSSSAEASIKCAGINSCKGQTSCHSATNQCKGKNNCKGQGWLNVSTKADCDAKGGKVI